MVPGLSVVNLCLNAAGLCQEQIFIGVTALARRLCSLSSTGVLGLNKVPGLSAVSLCWNAPGLCQVQNFKGVTALTTRLFVACLTEQHWGSGPEHDSRLECCESMLECSRTVSRANLHRCDCNGKKAVCSLPQ